MTAEMGMAAETKAAEKTVSAMIASLPPAPVKETGRAGWVMRPIGCCEMGELACHRRYGAPSPAFQHPAIAWLLLPTGVSVEAWRAGVGQACRCWFQLAN